jgi:hypothetical protein
MNYNERKSYINRFFPEAAIKPEIYQELPDTVKSALEIEKDYFPEEMFERISSITYPDGTFDIIAILKRTDKHGKSPGTGIQVFNIDSTGKIIGRGKAFLNESAQGDSPYVGHPYVSWTQTSEGELKKGLATRRLYVLNHFCLQELGKPLRSSPSIVPEAKALWQKLFLAQAAKVALEDDGIIIYQLTE